MRSGSKLQYIPVTTSKSGEHEFYNIPLLGEAHIDSSHNPRGNYNIGEIINNIRNTDSRTISLRSMDDGLSSAGILNGDFLTVTLDIPLHNDDIAVVRLGSRIYIRKIFFDRNLIRLETAAPKSSPLIVDPKTPGFEILGKVTSVIREL